MHACLQARGKAEGSQLVHDKADVMKKEYKEAKKERREEIRLRQLLEEQVGAAGAKYRGRLC